MLDLLLNHETAEEFATVLYSIADIIRTATKRRKDADVYEGYAKQLEDIADLILSEEGVLNRLQKLLIRLIKLISKLRRVEDTSVAQVL